MQGKKNPIQSTVYILLKHPHFTKQYETTTVQIKTNTVQDAPKWKSQYNQIPTVQSHPNVHSIFIHKNFTIIHFTSK